MNLKEKMKKVKLDKLIEYQSNPKKHPDSRIDKIASSIKKFGFTVPILIKEDNEIIAGHGRVKAAKKLDKEEIPAIVRDDLSDAEAKAFRLADNKLTESEWDQELLNIELSEIEDLDIDTKLTGFDEEEISQLEDENTEVEEVETPNKDEVDTNIERGDILKLGDHRLMCGDATDEEDIEKLMNGNNADMVFTDPPYGKGGYTGRSGNHKEVEGDNLSPDKIKEFYNIEKEDNIYLCLDFEALGLLYEVRGVPDSLIVWKKQHFGMGNGYRRQYELVAFYGQFDSTEETDVWEIDRDNTSEYDHPTQKPVKLPARAIKNSSKPEDIVLDLFGGSGSTLIAAEQLDRKCYMMEIDPEYCEVIKQRWEDYTGKEAEYV